MHPRPVSPTTAPSASRLDGAGFASVGLAAFLGPFAFTAATPALGAIGRSLGAQGSASLVLASYGAAFAATLIVGGRLGDAWGRRRMLMLGLAMLGVASSLAAVAPTMPLLLAARVGQGVGAGLFFPQLLATVQATTGADDRLRRVAQYTALLSLGVTGGQVAGGLLVAMPRLGWRAIMVALALLAVGALAVSRHVPASGGDGAGVDVGGALLLVTGLGAVLAGLSLAASSGPRILALAGAGLVALLVLGAWSLRRERAGRTVLISPEALAVPAVALGCAAVLVFYTAFTGFLVSWSAYAERFGGPSTGSITFVLPGAVFLLTALQLNRVVARLGARTPLLGAAVQAVALGALWLAVGSVRGLSGVWLLVPLVALMTLGNSLMYGPLMPVIMGGVPHDRAGMASGLFATAQQVAMALGSAAFGAFWAGATALAPASAMRLCLGAMLAACAVYAVLAQALRRRA